MNIIKYLFSPKYRFFRRKVHAVTRQIWDLEFKVEKSLQVREGVRHDRDKLLDARNRMETALKGDPNNKQIQSDFDGAVTTIKRYEAQMEMIDREITGVKAEGENPGVAGLNDLIDSLAELRKMYQQYLTKI